MARALRTSIVLAAPVVAITVALTLWGGAHRAMAQPNPNGEPGAEQTPPPAAVGQPDDGRSIYQQDCAVCHGAHGEGSYRGPRIDGRGTADVDFMVSTGRMPIQNPTSNIPRGKPAYTDAQIRDLVAYTSSFLTGPLVPSVGEASADLGEGGELYRLNCASCHQAVGAGGALAYGTTAPSLDRSTSTQVVEAMRVGPGTMPVFAPEQLDDKQAADIATYVQYLRHPENRGGWALGHLGPVPEGLVAWALGLGSLALVIRWLGTRDRVSTD